MKNSALPGFYKSVLAESLATILDRDLGATIQHWMELVENDNELTCIPLSFEDRAGHIPNLIAELVNRLRLDVTTTIQMSVAAREHGDLRRKQGYRGTPPP